jgi:DNA-binding protein HU-beta
MNKSELVQMLSNRTKMSKADASRAVEALFNPDDGIIPATLRDGDRVQITGFGTFETRERKARTGRNPRTGKEIRIGPTTSASFRPGKALKDSVRPDEEQQGGDTQPV